MDSDLVSLVSLLTPEERTELVRAFPETFRRLYEEGVYSKTWFYKLVNGKRRPSSRVVLEACQRDPRVVEWIKQRVRARLEAVRGALDGVGP